MASLYVIIEYTRPLREKWVELLFVFFGEPEKNTCIDLRGCQL